MDLTTIKKIARNELIDTTVRALARNEPLDPIFRGISHRGFNREDIIRAATWEIELQKSTPLALLDKLKPVFKTPTDKAKARDLDAEYERLIAGQKAADAVVPFFSNIDEFDNIKKTIDHKLASIKVKSGLLQSEHDAKDTLVIMLDYLIPFD
jgi:hypothetical protein